MFENFHKRLRADTSGNNLLTLSLSLRGTNTLTNLFLTSLVDYSQVFPYHPMIHAFNAPYCFSLGLPSQPPLSTRSTSSTEVAAETSKVVNKSSDVHWSKIHEIERSDHPSEESAKTRRNRGDCRFCPCRSNGKRVSRVTTFRCKECKTYLHPECFMKYHRRKYDRD